jgi:endonuclease/exonuclease/phosphatase family metal-dependent hydrolase
MRVMTWNLWWRFGDWRARLDAIAEVVRQEQPDICGLQEVWTDPERNQAEWLAAELGMHVAFGAPSDQQRWRDKIKDQTLGYGTAVLSRWPIRDPQIFDLPLDPSRPALSVVIDAPHASVPFTTVHLSVIGGPARRMAQVEWLARHVATQPVTDYPPIVVGDFNAEPESDEIRRFGGRLTPPIVDGQVFLDAWLYAPPGDHGLTWDRANPYVAQWIEPSGRIDYIHVVGRPSDAGRIRSVRNAGRAAVDGVWPSDHAAVVADLADGVS